MGENNVLRCIGEKITQLRLSNGISQKALSEELGVGQSIVVYWEKGEREIKATTVEKLANLFNVTPNYLMGYEDTIVYNENEVIRFSKADVEVLKAIQQNRAFMTFVRENPTVKINRLLNLWNKVVSVIKD